MGCNFIVGTRELAGGARHEIPGLSRRIGRLSEADFRLLLRFRLFGPVLVWEYVQQWIATFPAVWGKR